MRLPSRTRRARTFSLERCEPRCLLTARTVTSAIDGAPGSLRAVIASSTAGDVIGFSPGLRGARLALTQGELVIDKTLTVLGSGQTLDAGGQSRVLEVRTPGANVQLSLLTFTGGVADFTAIPSPAFAGGGILVMDATLSLHGCIIMGNRAQGSPGGNGDAAIAAEGGGLFGFHTQLNLDHTSFISNQALGGVNSASEQAGNAGGGGFALQESQARLLGGRIQGNLAQGGDALNPITAFPSSDGGAGDGGGVLMLGADLSLDHVMLTNNRAVGGKGLEGALAPSSQPMSGPGVGGNAVGGGIFTEGSSGSATSTLLLSHVQMVNNVAQGGPAGMAKDNTQPAVPGGPSFGGAIGQLENTALLLQDTLIQGNQALGGAAARNISQGGDDTSAGGVAFGGAIHSESFTRILANRVQFRNNLAQGAPGGDSDPNSGTESGGGGPAAGGAWNLQDTGGLTPSPALPVTLVDVQFVNNQALAGPVGTGVVPAAPDGTNGYATGGAMLTSGIFQLVMNRTQWVNNQAIASQGELAFGGALGITNGFTTNRTLITGSQFRGNLARGGDDPQSPSPDLRTASGGAILINAPNTTIVGTTFMQNTAQGGNATGVGVPGIAKGGAIEASGGTDATPSLTLLNDRMIGNSALAGMVLAGSEQNDPNSGYARGGAIFQEDGTLNAVGVQFVSNLARSEALGTVHDASGGALYLATGTSAQLAGAQFQNNVALALGANSAFGGAIASFSNDFTDVASSFTGNQALVRGPGSAFGGGLYLAGTSSLTGSKITRNAALGGQGFGGGIAFAMNPKVVLRQVIVQRNRATTAGPDLFGDHQTG